jgi:hypothetical protein
VVYALIMSLGFGGLYAETALAHSGLPGQAATAGVVALLAFAGGFLVPPLLFRYSNDDVAPTVMTAVIRRALVATVLVLAADVIVWFAVGSATVELLEELYVYTFVAVLLVHGFGGAVASHVVYLQQTHQYNSNQLVAVLALVTLLLFTLLLYFLAFDYAIVRDAYIHIRDLTLITLVLVAYGRAVYLMAHH